MSSLFGKTLRENPAEAETESHRLLLRASLAAQLSAGVYAYLPLGLIVLRRIEDVIRREMDAEGGQEMLMPSILPIELYQQTGRDLAMGEILLRLTDHRGREFALGPTHEEAFVDLFKRNVRSYRDMPLLVYQIAAKFRDEPRPRGGLIRLRQFIMKDLYSFDADWEGLDVSYQKMFNAYTRIFDRCGVPTVPVLADSGAMGGRDTHEFIYLTDIGEDSLLLCPGCGYAANAEVAEFVKEPAHAGEEPAPVQEIDTPGMATIQELARFLGVPESRTCKAVFYSALLSGQAAGKQANMQASKQPDRGPRTETRGGEESSIFHLPSSIFPGEGGRVAVFVAIRGDLDVNEAKLRKAIGATELACMDEEAVQKAGFVAGSASAVGLRAGTMEPGNRGTREGARTVLVVADDLVLLERNLVAGANKPGKHLLNVNYGRDWTADAVADIALAREGYACSRCRTPMDLRRGIEMGQVFKLGTKYSEDMGALFLDSEGKQRPAVMGSYGIGVERLLAAVIEEHHDENGIVWPAELAPFQVHMVAIQPERPDVSEAAERLYEELRAAGVRVLYDDRDESPGVKFKDADLLGMPLRVTVSPRNLDQGRVEVKGRTEAGSRLVALDRAAEEIGESIGAIEQQGNRAIEQ
jgi:prolyl-tRNA synthetase